MNSFELKGFICFISAFTALSFISTLFEKDLIDFRSQIFWWMYIHNKHRMPVPSPYLLLSFQRMQPLRSACWQVHGVNIGEVTCACEGEQQAIFNAPTIAFSFSNEMLEGEYSCVPAEGKWLVRWERSTWKHKQQEELNGKFKYCQSLHSRDNVTAVLY